MSALAALYAETTEFRNPFSPETLTSRAAVAEFVAPMFEAYSEMRAEPDGVLAVGDWVATRLTIHARHTGDLRRPDGLVAATGRTARLRTAEFLRVNAGDLIVEHERIFDSAPLLAQLGLA